MCNGVVRKASRHQNVHACCAGRYGRQRGLPVLWPAAIAFFRIVVARYRESGSERLLHSGALQKYIAQTQPGFMSRFVIYAVHFLCSGLNSEDVRLSTPLTEALYCTPTRRAPSRYAGETGTRKPPQQRIREKCLCAAPAHVHPTCAVFCCWSTSCSPHPARSADWPHGTCLALAPRIP
jgi:hypothetical protein